jgi:hypothetical protein
MMMNGMESKEKMTEILVVSNTETIVERGCGEWQWYISHYHGLN